MPPKVTFTKEHIIKAAINLIRKKGGMDFTIRKLAAELGASTQPIYRVFKNQSELELTVEASIKKQLLQKLVAREKDESDFLSIGLAYLEFAIAEPKLAIYLNYSEKKSRRTLLDAAATKQLLAKMKQDDMLNCLSNEVLEKILMDMHFYSQGLVTDLLFNRKKLEFTEYRKRLHDMGESLILGEFVKAGKIDMFKKMAGEKNESSNS